MKLSSWRKSVDSTVVTVTRHPKGNKAIGQRYMTCLIKLESIAQETPVEILTVDTGSLTMGREPENHIVVDSDSVSRKHGALIEASGTWFYRDFESTNGSWVNGVRLSPGQMKLLRDGDVIQLADFPIRLSHVEPLDGTSIPSVLVFYNNRFESELLFEEGGQVFSIGGPNASFFLEGANPDQAQLQITFDGSRLELSTGSGGPLPVLLRGIATSGITKLSDRDDVVLGAYHLFISDTASAVPVSENLHRAGAGTSPESGFGQAYDRPNAPSHLRRREEDEWESEAARRRTLEGKRFVFGTDPDAMEVTSTLPTVGRMGVGGSSGFEMSASQRFSQAVSEAEARGAGGIPDNLIIAFGVFVFCAILGFLGYFFFVL